MKHTNIKLQTLEDKELGLSLKNIPRGGISSVMGDRYIKSGENENILYIDDNKLYGHSMSQRLPYDENKFDRNVKLEGILNTPDDSDFGYFVEFDFKYADGIKGKTTNFLFCPENIISPQDKVSKHMEDLKPVNHTQNKKLMCYWTDKKIN